MILILNIILVFILNDKIDEINRLTNSAEKSFFSKNYDESIRNYKTLIDSLDYSNEKIYLNLAHSYLLSNDTLNAIENYNFASLTENNKIKSIALQQLGNINEKNKKLDEALSFYKESIIADNNNEDSKYNYELVKRRIEEEKKKNQQNNKKDQNKNSKDNQKKNQSENKKQDKEGKEDKNNQNQDEQKQNKENKNNEKKSKEESVEEKLKKINMTKKKAEMILNALNNNEFQYIQQLKRKPSKKTDKSKPDW
tara:strand:+ start:1062 stop:1820 length:759 start_codon:yes stop_codon:yes gene_type:complete